MDPSLSEAFPEFMQIIEGFNHLKKILVSDSKIIPLYVFLRHADFQFLIQILIN